MYSNYSPYSFRDKWVIALSVLILALLDEELYYTVLGLVSILWILMPQGNGNVKCICKGQVFLIQGSSANCGKTTFATAFAKKLPKSVVLSSDKIRIRLHSGVTPSHTAWDKASKETQENWGKMFDNSAVEEHNVIGMTDNEDPWLASARITAEYILAYIQNHPNQNIIIEGQFQIIKEANLRLVAKLVSEYGAKLIYIKTPIKFAKNRHANAGKNYDEELIKKYASGNLTIQAFLEEITFGKLSDDFITVKLSDDVITVKLSDDVITTLRSTNQLIINGAQPVDDMVEEVLETTLFHYNATHSGYEAQAKLAVEIEALNNTRADYEKQLARAEYANPIVLTAEGNTWSLDAEIIGNQHSSLCEEIKNQFDDANPLFTACKYQNNDMPPMFSQSFTPPMYVQTDKVSPEILLNMETNQGITNCFDVPCFVYIGGKWYSAIPNEWIKISHIIKKKFVIFLEISKNSYLQDGTVFIVSVQVSTVGKEQFGSLGGLHHDNVRSNYYSKYDTFVKNTSQLYPTLLYTQVELKETDSIEPLPETALGTNIYSCSPWSLPADILDCVSKLNVDKNYVPLELANKISETDLQLHQGKNGVISIFSHLHSSVINNTGKDVVRLQIRCMAVTIKQNTTDETNETILLGYDKQSPNIALDELLKKSGCIYQLNSYLKSGCDRYQHIDPDTGKQEVYPNPQFHAQIHGVDNAISKGLIN